MEKPYSFEKLPQIVFQLVNEVKHLNSLVKDLSAKEIQTEERIDVTKVSETSGYSPNYIYQLVHKNEIPYHKAEHGGRKLIFYRSEIEEWLKGKKQETNQEYFTRKHTELHSNSKGGVR